MSDLTTLQIDFNDCWRSGGGVNGWVSYEPDRVTTGQTVQIVDSTDETLCDVAVVVSRSQYVAFLLPPAPPAETDDESSL